MMFAAGWLCAIPAENIVFPSDAGIRDVSKSPYSLGHQTGAADVTSKLQQALNDAQNTGDGGANIVYLPNGTYLISNTLKWPGSNPIGGSDYKLVILQGQSRDGTVIKLKNSCTGFLSETTPLPMVWTGVPPEQRFRNAVRNLTLNVGSGNPGAVGLSFIASNQGCVRDVLIVAPSAGVGYIGLDLTVGTVGPLLIKNVKTVGFKYGIKVNSHSAGVTFEHITIENPTFYGLCNEQQLLAIRDFKYTGEHTAIDNMGFHGVISLIDASITGTGAAATKPAIMNNPGCYLYARNIRTTGFRQAIVNYGAPPGRNFVDSTTVTEFSSDTAKWLFPSPRHSLCIPIEETPEVPWDDLSQWQRVNGSDGAAIQTAIDAGKTTVYLPRGRYVVSQTVHIRGKVRRIIGCEASIDVAEPLAGQNAPLFRFEDGDYPVVVFERLQVGFTQGPFYGIDQATKRTLVMSSVIMWPYKNSVSGGKLFLEDVCMSPMEFNGINVWARQLNPEYSNPQITNNGGSLWILGIKIEGGGTVIKSINKAQTEVLGGCIYTLQAPLGPMWINDQSRLSLGGIGETDYAGTVHFATVVQETRDGVTKTINHEAFPLRLGGVAISLYVGYKAGTVGVGQPGAATTRRPLRPAAKTAIIINGITLRKAEAQGAALFDITGKYIGRIAPVAPRMIPQLGTGKFFPTQAMLLFNRSNSYQSPGDAEGSAP